METTPPKVIMIFKHTNATPRPNHTQSVQGRGGGDAARLAARQIYALTCVGTRNSEIGSVMTTEIHGIVRMLAVEWPPDSFMDLVPSLPWSPLFFTLPVTARHVERDLSRKHARTSRSPYTES